MEINNNTLGESLSNLNSMKEKKIIITKITDSHL